MDFVDRKTELKRYFPAPFYRLKPGQGLSILLEITGDKLNTLTTQSGNARQQFLLASAVGKYLDVHGVNVDVYRPRGFNMPDNVYRELIKIVTNSSKNIEAVFDRILILFFGANAIQNGIAAVSSVKPNQIILEIQEQALIIASSRDLYGTHYLHNTDQAYDGESYDPWGPYTLTSTLLQGSMGFTLTSVPIGMPTEGHIAFAGLLGPTEVKRYTRSGLNVTFDSETLVEHSAGERIEGPKFPDDYPSGYIYDSEYRSDLVGSYLANAITLNLGVFPENIPQVGTVFIGSPTAFNFEAKGYTKSSPTSNVLNLKGGLGFAHSSGDSVIVPNMPRKFKTTLNQTILAGQSFSEITVANAADFGLSRGAIRLAQSFGNEEIVPFISRKISDNTKLLIDPNYTFVYDHAPGEKVQLMSRKTRVSTDGLNWPFYLNDTDALREQFFNMLKRLKAQGVRMVFEIIENG